MNLEGIPNGCTIACRARGLHIWPIYRDGLLHWAGHAWKPGAPGTPEIVGIDPTDLWRVWNDA